MKCPECVAVGLRRTETAGGTSTTLMWSPAFYDEDGKYHDHDPNKKTAEYACSNGHKWVETSRGKCPSCDWPEAA